MTDSQNSANKVQNLSADKPLTNPESDLFGYAPFASKLADGISKMTPPDGLVMAIYGPWGSGKSTLIEFVLSYLDEKPSREKPIVIRFNPWWFSGQENLFRHFFDQLYTELESRFGQTLKTLISSVQELSDLLATVPIPGSEIVKSATDKIPNPKKRDITKVKDSIAKLLKQQDQRILIVIDDIDRLTPEEIRQLFGLIKAVANFPNVIYLLAFDKKIVSNALTSISADLDDRFIEKIVQVPFEMPYIRRDSLNELFLGKIADLVGHIPSRLFNRYVLGTEGYLFKFQHFFNTPRDIFRLVNTLTITYPAVKDEVDPADFIAIEALRVFQTELYNLIRSNKEWFTTQKQINGGLDATQEILSREHHDIQNLINRLFPYSKPNAFGHAESYQWRKERRVCSPDIFDVYFRFSISQDAISYQEMMSIIELSNQGENISDFFLKVNKDNIRKYRHFFAWLIDYWEPIREDGAISIIRALLDVGDKINKIDEENSENSLFRRPLRVYMAGLITELLKKIDPQARYEKLKAMLIQASSVYLVLDVVYELGQQHGRYGNDKRPAFVNDKILDLEDVVDLEKKVIPKLQTKLNTIGSFDDKNLRNVLRFWSWVDPEAPRKWVQTRLNTPSLVIQFVSGFIAQVGYDEYEVDETLFLYFDPANLRELIANYIEHSELTDDELKIGKIFLTSTEHMTNSDE